MLTIASGSRQRMCHRSIYTCSSAPPSLRFTLQTAQPALATPAKQPPAWKARVYSPGDIKPFISSLYLILKKKEREKKRGKIGCQ